VNVSRAPAAAALLAAAALAACGGSAPRPSPHPATFIDLVPALPSTLDPAADGGPGFAALETSLAGTLVRPVGVAAGAAALAAPQRVTGYLARSWTRLADGALVFRLRAGVRSPYGHTLTAMDVRFSLTRELARSPAARALARVAGISLADPVTVLGPETVRINAAGPGSLALAVLSGYRFGVLDARAVRAHAGGWLARHLASYGAYGLASFVPRVRVLLVANPGWPTRPAFPHVAVEADRSPALRLALVGAHLASHTSGLDWSAFAAATRTNGIDAQLWPSTDVEELAVDGAAAPLASPAVRRAISLALDRPAISRAAYAGFARPVGGGLDPALARRLLARAGYRDGFALTLAGSGAAIAPIERDLRAVGIDARIRPAGHAALELVSAPYELAGGTAPPATPAIELVEVPSQNVTDSAIAGYAGYAVQATYYDLLQR
jgi:peptide/nickel transport system substrate-binding protein/glutathione transport system substrate-binding protein